MEEQPQENPELKELIAKLQKMFPDFQGAVMFHLKDGQPVASPIFPADKDTTVGQIIDTLRAWSNGLNFMANDMAYKMGLSKRKN